MENLKAEMTAAATMENDVAARLIASKATHICATDTKVWHTEDGVVRTYNIVMELEDVEVRLEWDCQDGFDGPSTTADVLAKMYYEKERECARADAAGLQCVEEIAELKDRVRELEARCQKLARAE